VATRYDKRQAIYRGTIDVASIRIWLRDLVISTSDLDWTIARLNRLTSKPATGAITTSTSLLTKPRPHTRADAASILLNLAETTTSAQTAINISGA
jgi:hypothetical protein